MQQYIHTGTSLTIYEYTHAYIMSIKVLCVVAHVWTHVYTSTCMLSSEDSLG